jgi:tRNA G18 (ribose-2'-O)-methylase SpoU
MKIHSIESPKNPVFRQLESLLETSGIAENGEALIFGKKVVSETLNRHPNSIRGIIVFDNEDFFPKEVLRYSLTPVLFKKLDIFGTHSPILVVKVPEMPRLPDTFSGRALLLPFQDPSNVGACLRTALGFGIKNIILAPSCSHPFHPKSVRSASGTLFEFNFFRIKSFEDLKAVSIPIIALDKSGAEIGHFQFPKEFILMPGLEGPGLTHGQREVATETVSIAISNSLESLNAVVATGIALFVSGRQ